MEKVIRWCPVCRHFTIQVEHLGIKGRFVCPHQIGDKEVKNVSKNNKN